jgi:hypothetical protein
MLICLATSMQIITPCEIIESLVASLSVIPVPAAEVGKLVGRLPGGWLLGVDEDESLALGGVIIMPRNGRCVRGGVVLPPDVVIWSGGGCPGRVLSAASRNIYISEQFPINGCESKP